MKYTKNSVSLFAIVAFIVYLISVFVNLQAFSTHVNNVTDYFFPLMYLNVLVFFAFCLVGIRLYMHGWAVDESFIITRIMSVKPNHVKHFFETFFRLFWLSLSAFLPFVFAKKYIIFNGWIIGWDLYLLITFFLLCLWDIILMKDIIMESTKHLSRVERVKMTKNIKRNLVAFDVFMFVLCFINVLLWEINWRIIDPRIANWGFVWFVICLMVIVGICIVQIIIFVGEILKGKIEFEYRRK